MKDLCTLYLIKLDAERINIRTTNAPVAFVLLPGGVKDYTFTIYLVVLADDTKTEMETNNWIRVETGMCEKNRKNTIVEGEQNDVNNAMPAT